VSRLGKRRRRSAGEPEPEAVEGEVIAAAERIDPRLLLAAPDDVQHSPEALIAWAREHYPEAVRADAEVRRERQHLDAIRRLQQARRTARRRGDPEPDSADFFTGRTPAARSA
jgi:hypothetical protein